MRRSTVCHPGRGQRGIALVVVLLLLLIVTLIGLAAMRGTLLQEQMAGNTMARANAFQLAEAVLREGESAAALVPPMPTGTACNAAGLCPNPGINSDGYWQTASNYKSATSVTIPTGGAAGYVIEDMGTGSAISDSCNNQIDVSAGGCSVNVKRYRITSRVRTNSGTEVVLQTNYQVE